MNMVTCKTQHMSPTYLLIYMKTTGGDASWINGKNEIHNRSIHNMVIAGLIDFNQYANKFWCAEDT